MERGRYYQYSWYDIIDLVMKASGTNREDCHYWYLNGHTPPEDIETTILQIHVPEDSESS